MENAPPSDRRSDTLTAAEIAAFSRDEESKRLALAIVAGEISFDVVVRCRKCRCDISVIAAETIIACESDYALMIATNPTAAIIGHVCPIGGG